MSVRSLITVTSEKERQVISRYNLFTNAQFPFEVEESIQCVWYNHKGDPRTNNPKAVYKWLREEFMEGYICKPETRPTIWFILDYYYELTIRNDGKWVLNEYDVNHPILKEVSGEPAKEGQHYLSIEKTEIIIGEDDG